jgi:hypothetical protein
MSLIDFSSAPEDPIERLMWLSGIDQALRKEVDQAWAEAYFDARVKGLFAEALSLHLHSKKKALAWTRHVNNERDRVVWRWRDGYGSSPSA